MTGREKLLLFAGIGGALALTYFGGGETVVKSLVAGSKNEETWGPVVDAMAARVGIEPEVARAIVMQESHWVPTARNLVTGDYGLFQLNLRVAKKLRPSLADRMPEVLYDPPTNISIAEDVFREITQKGRVTDAAGIFNSWNVGWPSYLKGVVSPSINKYLAFYADYGGNLEA